MRVLVIEDDPVSLKLARIVLEDAGHTVAEFMRADDALIAIKSDPPDLILLDLALPAMNGLEVTRRLKEDESTRNIPVIAVTSFPERFKKEELLKAGCDAFVIKPIDTRNLSMQVAETIATKAREK